MRTYPYYFGTKKAVITNIYWKETLEKVRICYVLSLAKRFGPAASSVQQKRRWHRGQKGQPIGEGLGVKGFGGDPSRDYHCCSSMFILKEQTHAKKKELTH